MIYLEIEELYEAAEIEGAISDPDVANLVIDKDRVLDRNSVPGVVLSHEEIEDGIKAELRVEENTVIEAPIHLCFGVTATEGRQHIVLDIDVGEGAEIGILAHCIFPRAEDVEHVMDADIRVGEGAEYEYLEKHIHSPEGGIEVVPRAEVELEEGARFETDFELIEGKAGKVNIDYETKCRKNSVLDMTAKIDGKAGDDIEINETGNLVGEGSRGVLTSRVALRGDAEAKVFNKLSATAPRTRGHVDCKEIVQDESTAEAVPIVHVQDPSAHVTHEAAIGSVDKKQLETLMSRGLTEEEGVDLIIDGLLS